MATKQPQEGFSNAQIKSVVLAILTNTLQFRQDRGDRPGLIVHT